MGGVNSVGPLVDRVARQAGRADAGVTGTASLSVGGPLT